MSGTRVWQFAKAWVHNLVSIRAGSALLSSFGVLWLCVEVADYFFKQTQLAATLQQSWWLFFAAGVVVAAAICRPRLRVSYKLNGRDVTIEIAVGDMFDFPGALVVGTNTTFDTRISRQLISEKSVQGQFTKRYYGDETQLNAELQTHLAQVPYEELPEARVGKNRRYPIGTVVRLNPRDRAAYFVATAHVNEYGVASGTYENLKNALAELWVFIGDRGMKETLVTPILGTGLGRLTTPREEVVREIVKSFVAACAEKVFCDNLTVVLLPRDLEKCQMSLERLGDYLRHVCCYTEFSSNDEPKRGQPAE